jgi:hypothetical protein
MQPTEHESAMKTRTTLILLGATMALATSAHAFIVVRGGFVATPYMAPYPYYAAPVYVAPANAPPPPGYYDPPPAPTSYYGKPIVQPPAPIGGIYYTLPLGAQSTIVGKTQYYVLGDTYYLPHFGSNGVYYEVVPTPPGTCGSGGC